MICSNALNSREKPAVSPMSGSPTFDVDKLRQTEAGRIYKKNRNGTNLQLRHALRAGGVITVSETMSDIDCNRHDVHNCI